MAGSRAYLTAKELAGCTLQRWQFPDVSDSLPEPPAESDEQAVAVQEEGDPAPPVHELALPTAEEIERIKQDAYAEAAAAGREEGYRKGLSEGQSQGYAAGYAAGQAQSEAESKSMAARWNALLAGLDQPFRELDEQVEEELMHLVVAIAKQLIRRELRADPGQIMAVIREALNALPVAARGVVLWLHPDDAELVRGALALDEELQRWRIVEEPLLTRGGCRVTSEVSAIDATVEKRFAAVIAQVLGDERGTEASA